MALKTFTINNGSANQALVTNGSGVLSFAAVGASAGQVIQVVTATDSTERSGTSSTFSLNSSTLTLNITPSAAANKIYITLSTTVEVDGNNLQGKLTIFRDSTDLGAASNLGLGSYYGGYAPDGANSADNITCAILDSPNTTSSITYQIRFRNTNNSSPIYINKYGMKGSITAFEIKG